MRERSCDKAEKERGGKKNGWLIQSQRERAKRVKRRGSSRSGKKTDKMKQRRTQINGNELHRGAFVPKIVRFYEP